MHPALREFNSWIHDHPIYGLVGFQALVTTGRIGGLGEGLNLLSVRVPDDRRGEGHGRAMMAKLLEVADNHDLPVSLEASEHTASSSWLQRWYARRGFEPTGERGHYGPIMVRPVNIIFST